MSDKKSQVAFPLLFPRSLFEWPDVEPWFSGALATEGVMRVDECHKDGELVVRAEIPGIDPDRDVDIRVVDGALRISAEKRRETTVDEKDLYRSEIQYGAFSRVVPLPRGCSENDVRASYRDGVLEVHIPAARRPEKESTKVAVARG